MNDQEFFAVVWSAINAEVPPIEIMRAIEKHIGKKNAFSKWDQYFDSKKNTIDAVRDDLKKA